MINFKLNPYVYKIVNVKRVVDGDTIELLVDIGFSILIEKKFRLLGYDSPETFRPQTPSEGIAGEKIKNWLINIINLHLNELFIETTKIDSFGRYLGKLYFLENNQYICINDLI